MITNKQIIQKITKAKNIAIFGHRDPDPDAFGSMLGLRGFCRQLGKSAEVFCDHYGDFAKGLYPVDEFKSKFYAKDFDLVIFVDLHVENRVEDCFLQEIKKCKNKIVIDHHILAETETVPTKDFRIVYKASASQLILDLFREAKITPNVETATYIYSGLVGDTGRFLHVTLSPQVFDDAKYLLECGAKAQDVYDDMFRTITNEQIKLSNFLYSNLKYLANGKVAYIVFTIKNLRKLNANIDDVKMFSNSLINIKDVRWSLLIYETSKNVFRFSMRSMPEIDLVPLATKMSGGGHKNAAAFSANIKYSQLHKNIRNWVDEVIK